MPIWAIAMVALAVVTAALAVRAWLAYRGERVVLCPENQKPAGVALEVGSAVGFALRHPADLSLWKGGGLHLATCSRWPERSACGQQCLSQVQAAPQDCLVRNILSRWYEGKACAWCGQPFGPVEWETRKPALLDAGGISREWDAVPADRLQETLASARPVCFACHMATTLVREHPDLVTERPIASRGSADH